MGMGTAGVAMGQGGVGSYWNPAGLGQVENPSGLQVPVSAHAEITGTMIEGANDLNQLGKDCQAGAATCTTANINAALNKFAAPESGIRADVGVGASVKIKKVVVFVNNFAYAGGIPVADTVNTGATALLQNQNNSKIILRGLSVTEIGVGYGREVPFLPGLLIGANLKGLVGKAAYYDLFVLRTDAGTSGAFKNFLSGAKQSFQPGVDVGALWDMNKTFAVLPMRPRVGITAHNINNPKFTQPDQAKNAGERDHVSLQGNVRAGAAISPLHFWNIAADLDLTRNLTPVNGVASRNFGLGTEINVFNRSWLNIPLRVGITRNLANSAAKTSLTGGFGLNFLHVIVDLGAAVSPTTVTVQSQGSSQKFPNNVSAAGQVAIMFGGA